MMLSDPPGGHLTYCMNIHRGETWPEVFANIEKKTLAVRDQVTSPQRPFGLGLRLSCQAAEALARETRLNEFHAFLRTHHLYPFTINGFPYGPFHGRPVKEQVYQPDWRSRERSRYTCLLAQLLAKLLPEESEGSISTVPGSYKSWIQSEEDVRLMVLRLMDAVAKLAEIKKQTGQTIHIGLEPEPDCFLETTAEIIAFFKGPIHIYGRKYLAGLMGCGESEAGEIIHRHLGVCLDTCHMALQFEDPAQSLIQLHAQGIRISKVQISAALEAAPSQEARKQLQKLCDPVYLHQVKEIPVLRGNHPLRSYPDLEEALKTSVEKNTLWRIHYHVPLYWQKWKNLSSTAKTLTPEFWSALKQGLTSHIEIETYTFDVLPDELKGLPVTDMIAREYAWVLSKLQDCR